MNETTMSSGWSGERALRGPRRGAGVVAALAVVLTNGTTALAEPVPAAKPAVKELQKLFGRGPGASAPPALAGLGAEGSTWRVNHVVGDAGGGLFVAIGIVTTTRSEEDIAAERELFGGWDGTYATERLTPFVCVVRRAADGSFTVASAKPLPFAQQPDADLAWGFAKVEDVDGDGRAELAVVKGYRSYAPGSTYGEERLKEITWLSIAPDGAIAVQAHLVTERRVGDAETPSFQTSYRLVPHEGSPLRDLRVTRSEGDVKATSVWTYDAKRDLWVEPASPVTAP